MVGCIPYECDVSIEDYRTSVTLSRVQANSLHVRALLLNACANRNNHTRLCLMHLTSMNNDYEALFL